MGEVIHRFCALKRACPYVKTPLENMQHCSRETRFFRETLEGDRKSPEAASQLAYRAFSPMKFGDGCSTRFVKKTLFGLQQNHDLRGQKQAK